MGNQRGVERMNCSGICLCSELFNSVVIEDQVKLERAALAVLVKQEAKGSGLSLGTEGAGDLPQHIKALIL